MRGAPAVLIAVALLACAGHAATQGPHLSLGMHLVHVKEIKSTATAKF